MPPVPLTEGAIAEYTSPNPPAGFQAVLTAPPNVRWRIISIRAGFITDATVINRRPFVEVVPITTLSLVATSNLNIPAGSSVNLNFMSGWPTHPTNVDTDLSFPLPTDVYVLGTGTITVGAINLQPGDDIGSIFAVVEEWIQL